MGSDVNKSVAYMQDTLEFKVFEAGDEIAHAIGCFIHCIFAR